MRGRDPFGRALAEIRGRIRTGAVLPGQSLIVDDLARDLALSPTPVREALAFLSGEGMVVARAAPARGYVAASLSAAELGDLYRMHAQQLVFAISEAGRRRQTLAVVFDHSAGVAARTADLFEAIVRSSGNRALVRSHVALADRLHRARLVEGQALAGVEAELEALSRLGPDLSMLVRRYHRRRIAAREQIAELASEPVAPGARNIGRI